jgi:flagellar hook-length control protein FliK
LFDVPKIVSEFGSRIGLQKTGIARIVLNPQVLGTVFVEINMNGEKPIVSFKAENKKALEAIEKNLDALKEMFAQTGMKEADFRFDKFNNESSNNRENQHSKDNQKENLFDRNHSEQNQQQKQEEQKMRREYSDLFTANIQNEQTDETTEESLNQNNSNVILEEYV